MGSPTVPKTFRDSRLYLQTETERDGQGGGGEDKIRSVSKGRKKHGEDLLQWKIKIYSKYYNSVFTLAGQQGYEV